MGRHGALCGGCAGHCQNLRGEPKVDLGQEGREVRRASRKKFTTRLGSRGRVEWMWVSKKGRAARRRGGGSEFLSRKFSMFRASPALELRGFKVRRGGN